ncbi:sugar phosphate nucleotidyltransferase, partial [Hydrotalea sp.]|uniref:sugar phosphate nucleotidyltransferase n=1 Tax=Hydrotalea sp. TaxID=2881279 RepID=UPI00260EC9A3
MNKNYYVAIMAGGIGSRFWPKSRTAYPKQFLDILNTGKTLIQWTYERFACFIPAENKRFLLLVIATMKGKSHMLIRTLPSG